MNKLENTVASFFSNNHRYIKVDGSGFYSGKLKSIFERATFNAGAMALLGLAAFDFFNQSDLSALEPENLANLGKNIGIFSVIQFLPSIISKTKSAKSDKKNNSTSVRNIFEKYAHKAIDTKGTSLSRANLSHGDIFDLKIGRGVGLLVPPTFAVVAYYTLSHIYGLDGLAIHTACVFGSGLSLANRTNKLVKGHTGEPNGYVFCDEPPAKPEKSKSRSYILGGITSPS